LRRWRCCSRISVVSCTVDDDVVRSTAMSDSIAAADWVREGLVRRSSRYVVRMLCGCG